MNEALELHLDIRRTKRIQPHITQDEMELFQIRYEALNPFNKLLFKYYLWKDLKKEKK